VAVLLSRRFVLAWLVSFFSGLAFFLFVHFPRYLEGLGADPAEVGRIVGATALAGIAIRPMVGRAMDRRGRRPVVLAGNALHVVALLFYLTVDHIGPWLYSVRILHGFGEALLFAATFTIAADIIPAERRTEGLALFGVSGLLPIAVGGVLGDFLLARYPFHSIFVAALVLGVAGGLLALPLSETAVPADADHHLPFTTSLRQRDLLPIWWITLVFSFALTAYFTFLRLHIDESGIGSMGGFFGSYATTAVVLRLFGGSVPDRIGLKRVLYPALLVFATGLLLLSSAGSATAVVVAGVFCGAGHAYGFPILFALCFTRARLTARGSAAVIFTGLFDVGVLAGAPLLGWVVNHLGYPAMFRIAAACVGIGLLSFAFWDRDLRIPRATNYTRVTRGPYSPLHDAGDPVTEPGK
jgi:MFS family permease